MTEYYSIPPCVLEQFAGRIEDAAWEGGPFKCEDEAEHNGLSFQLEFSGFAHMRDVSVTDDYYVTELSDIVPLWCEVRAFDDEGDEVHTLFNSNDFKANYLRF